MDFLVVVDAQNDFVITECDGRQGALAPKPEETEYCKKVVANIKKTIAEYTDKNARIIFTLDQHNKDEYPNSREGRQLPIKHCIRGTWGAEIIPELEPEFQRANHIVRKSTFGATQILPSWADDKAFGTSVDNIYFCGFDTDFCIISNVISAMTRYPNAEIFVIEKACWGSTLYGHNTALAAMKQLGVHII